MVMFAVCITSYDNVRRSAVYITFDGNVRWSAVYMYITSWSNVRTLVYGWPSPS